MLQHLTWDSTTSRNANNLREHVFLQHLLFCLLQLYTVHHFLMGKPCFHRDLHNAWGFASSGCMFIIYLNLPPFWNSRTWCGACGLSYVDIFRWSWNLRVAFCHMTSPKWLAYLEETFHLRNKYIYTWSNSIWGGSTELHPYCV